MNGPDDEFEDFVNRRKAVFERREDELFEPPAELDRVVLRQAREAIEPPEPMRVFSAPRWSMPIALAATLLLTFTIIFRVGLPPPKSAPKPEVTVQNVVERSDAQPAGRDMADARATMDAPAATAAAPPPKASDVPAWRRDQKSWMAEIQRLRDAGDSAGADAEYAEFKRQQRAYAVSHDR